MPKTNDGRLADWELLWPALRRLGAVVALGAILFATSAYHAESARNERMKEVEHMDAQRLTYHRLREAGELWKRFSRRYRDWKSRGVIGPERRQQWLETLQTTSTALRAEVTYDISSRALATGLPMDLPSQVHRSEMSLSMKVLHERDLFDLIASLEHHAQGLFSVDACELWRASAPDAQAATAGIEARCRLVWLTVTDEGDFGERPDG